MNIRRAFSLGIISALVAAVSLFVATPQGLAIPRIKNINDFVAAMPNVAAQTVYRCEQTIPLPNTQSEGTTRVDTLDEQLLGFFDLLSLGKNYLGPILSEHKIKFRQVWIWSDLTRVADEYKQLVPDEYNRPCISMLLLENAGSKDELQKIITHQAISTERIGEIICYKMLIAEHPIRPLYAVLVNDTLYTSTEREVFKQFLETQPDAHNHNSLLLSKAWKMRDQTAPIYVVTQKPILLHAQEMNASVIGNKAQMLFWGHPKQLEHEIVPEGGLQKITFSTLGDATKAVVTVDSSDDLEYWGYWFIIFTHGDFGDSPQSN